MNRRLRDFLGTFVLLFALGAAALFVAALNEVVVVGSARVIDGDSLVVAGTEIRLQDIDAPELGQLCENDDPAMRACGRQSRNHLRALIGNGDIECAGWEEDKYGRLLATCETLTKNLNRQMVADGWAVSYGAYEQHEVDARDGRLGMWSGSFSRPQDWRKDIGAQGNLASFSRSVERVWKRWFGESEK